MSSGYLFMASIPATGLPLHASPAMRCRAATSNLALVIKYLLGIVADKNWPLFVLYLQQEGPAN